MNKHQKLILLILATLLLALTAKNYFCGTKTCPTDITVNKGAVTEQLSLKEAEEYLKEKRRIDINTVTSSELQIIPGIGESLSARIVDYRDSHGRFLTESDLLKVKGIGEKKLKKMREYIKIK